MKKREKTEEADAQLALIRKRMLLLDPIVALDEEGFNYLAAIIWQTSKMTAGFRDKAGWYSVRTAFEQYMLLLRVPGEPDRTLPPSIPASGNIAPFKTHGDKDGNR